MVLLFIFAHQSPAYPFANKHASASHPGKHQLTASDATTHLTWPVNQGLCVFGTSRTRFGKVFGLASAAFGTLHGVLFAKKNLVCFSTAGLTGHSTLYTCRKGRGGLFRRTRQSGWGVDSE